MFQFPDSSCQQLFVIDSDTGAPLEGIGVQISAFDSPLGGVTTNEIGLATYGFDESLIYTFVATGNGYAENKINHIMVQKCVVIAMIATPKTKNLPSKCVQVVNISQRCFVEMLLILYVTIFRV